MQPKKSIMIVLTEVSPRSSGVFSALVTSERIHRILDANDVLAIPCKATPQMFSADQDQSIDEAMDKVVTAANSLTVVNLRQMEIGPNTNLVVKAYCVLNQEIIQSREVVLEHQKTEQPKPQSSGPKFLGDDWGVSQEDLVFFTVHTGDDSWKFVRDGKFVTGEFNPKDIIACRADATDYWMDMVKEVMFRAEKFFPAEVLKNAQLSVWQWRDQGSNWLLHERSFCDKVLRLRTITPVRSDATEQEDPYVGIPNASDFKSDYLVKEFTVQEVMAKVVELFANPKVDSMASHNQALQVIRWELLFKGILPAETCIAVTEIMDRKGWTIEFRTLDNITKMGITAHLKG